MVAETIGETNVEGSLDELGDEEWNRFDWMLEGGWTLKWRKGK